ncbi:PREDICTED: tumor necrosis factor receptor superfamily member 26-like [Lipotes vexillifer]|uniref:Tumor necrosis factor receptor superfamily member 26-like n=1 Tax=Lipotes vexillifer TaxID=118797 RepID=A0A340XY47_LIPVE|nr:PREDICTED: tumor necrosis factor receptor superfamily member 26-like [Lipotes vexillifer]
MATGETRCNPGEYEVTSLCRCSKLCPAGYYVSKYIDQAHSVGECRECESGSFRAHPSEESSCVPCSQCREDQEVVTECFPTSDRLCQCKQGGFYCDSMDCTESCFRCKRCEDSTILQPCNATRDTVCAVKIHPEAGGMSLSCLLPGRFVATVIKRALRGLENGGAATTPKSSTSLGWGNLKWLWIPFAATVVLSITTAIIIAVTRRCSRRENPEEPGSPVSITLGFVQ